MSCRCRDIRDCSRDLSVLNSALRQLERIRQSCEDLQEIQSVIQNWELEAFELEPGIRQKNQQVILRSESEITKISTENLIKITHLIERLENELRRMEREDERYHDEDDD